MNNLRKTFSLIILLLLVGCASFPIDSLFHSSETNNVSPTQTPIRISEQYPHNSPTATRIPEQIIRDIFLYDKTGMRFGTFFEGFKESYAEITPACAHTGNYGVNLHFDGSSLAGWHINNQGELGAFDVKNYRALELWVKGAIGGEEFDIDLATEFGVDTAVKSTEYIEVSRFEWRKIHIPLSDFENKAQKWNTRLYYISIYFMFGPPRDVCVDDIRFIP